MADGGDENSVLFCIFLRERSTNRIAYAGDTVIEHFISLFLAQIK